LTGERRVFVGIFLATIQLVALAGVIYYLKGWDWKGVRLFFLAAAVGCVGLAFTRRSFKDYTILYAFLFFAIHFNKLEYSASLSRVLSTMPIGYFYRYEPTFDNFLTGQLFKFTMISLAATCVIAICDLLLRVVARVLRSL
jgi:hypothetical protein